ncbi:MAG: flavodoxin family protein [Methanimicrococcus sp.]|nr:flavodoxin family protein [Methanimicrococcus sp.]
MKVIGILGSARENGNTDLLMQEMMKEPAAKGAETKIFNLAKMNIGCCLGCESCRKTGSCVRRDDVAVLFEEMKTADAIVIGTPIYMGEMTGQLKTFIDRCYALKDADRNSFLQAGKKLGIVITQGADIPGHYAKTPERIEYIFKGHGCVPAGTVTGMKLHDKDDVLADGEVLKKAREIGKMLI